MSDAAALRMLDLYPDHAGVHAARFLDALAFDLAGQPGTSWLTFHRMAGEVRAALGMGPLCASDAPWPGQHVNTVGS